ncbi:MAG TPA: type 1 glutamine amidotransferase [Solirubrobacterales bacterium]|nr:type 1 glutamine amidotransferase [Solirubrobacterales bacterium]
MRVLAIVHQRDAGPGVFADAARAGGARLETWSVAEGRSLPENLDAYDAVLTFGGAMHADHEGRHPWLREEKAVLAELLERGVPLLGVCLGAQLMAEAAGAPPRRASQPEIGWYEVRVTEEGAADPLLRPLFPTFEAFQWHSYEFPLPAGASPLARSDACLQAYRIDERAWGIQFHAEVTLEDADAWISDYRSDEDAVRLLLDAEGLRSRTHAAIGAWNELGRGLCERFLAAAEGINRLGANPS